MSCAGVDWRSKTWSRRTRVDTGAERKMTSERHGGHFGWMSNRWVSPLVRQIVQISKQEIRAVGFHFQVTPNSYYSVDPKTSPKAKGPDPRRLNINIILNFPSEKLWPANWRPRINNNCWLLLLRSLLPSRIWSAPSHPPPPPPPQPRFPTLVNPMVA